MGMGHERSWRTVVVAPPLVWLSVLVFVAAAIPYFMPALQGETLLTYSDVWSDVPLLGLVVFLILVRRPAVTSQRERIFWRAIAAGFSCWLAGRSIWGVSYSLGHPLDLTADFFFQMFYVCFLVALEMNPGRRPLSEFERRLRRYTLSGGTIVLLAIFAYFTVIPALLNRASYESWIPATISTMVLDTYVLVRLYGRYRSSEDPHWRRVYGWMSIAFAVWVVTSSLETVWLFDLLPVVYEATLFDLFWYVPYGLFIASVMAGRRRHDSAISPARNDESVALADFPDGTPMVPYAFALPLMHAFLVMVGISDEILRPARELLLVGVSLILAGLIYWTQRLILRENRRLRQGFADVSRNLEVANASLEQRVRDRTADLQNANRRQAAEIQERQQVEQQLRAAEARNRALIDAVPDALVLVDGAGVVRDVSPSRADTDYLNLGRSLGRPLGEFLPRRCRSEVERALAQVHGGRGPRAIPTQFESPDGTRHLDLRFGRCRAGEILVLVQDVTQRREFESSLQQSQKLESLGIMAGGIAHDFNNLLASILGNAQLSREALGEGAHVPSTLAAIESSAIRAAKLTGNLLAYAGEAHIELERLNLVPVFAELDTMLGAAIPKRIALTVEIGTEELWVDGNEAQLTQILLNLVRNAAEALAGGNGRIEADLHRVEVTASGLSGLVMGDPPAAGRYVRIRVSDNGCGMDAETQQRIFDPFYTSKGTGRGLGLAAVLGIVSHHHGALTLHSTPGQGTTFAVFLPARAAPARRDTERASTSRLHGSGTILIADDEPDVRELIVAFLQSRGFETIEATNGKEAVVVAQAHTGRLAAVVLDYAMPEMNGVDALGIIRREDPSVPVVMMSGYGERQALASLADAKHTVFVQKPFELSDLAHALHETLGLQAQQGEA